MSVGFFDNPNQTPVDLGPTQLEIIGTPGGEVTLHIAWTDNSQHIGVPLTIEHARQIALSLLEAVDTAEQPPDQERLH